jgi:uncharacterized repeat protein (TIGR01451 family)
LPSRVTRGGIQQSITNTVNKRNITMKCCSRVRVVTLFVLLGSIGLWLGREEMKASGAGNLSIRSTALSVWSLLGWTSRADAEDPHAAAASAAAQAAALALNDLRPTPEGVRLQHPRHTAAFTAAGVRFTARGGPDWHWRLAYAGPERPTANAARDGVAAAGEVTPVMSTPGQVAYARGGLVEQYLARATCVEQQFVIPQRLSLGGADLIIAGEVRSSGVFETAHAGWRWRTEAGVVSLGDVTVYDATGAHLPARMEVSAASTRIVVDGDALASATYPVTVDPEIGTNDFRISTQATPGGITVSSVAYNPVTEQYLVVWEGVSGSDANGDFKAKVYGQLIDARTGAEVGANDFVVAAIGPDSDGGQDATAPAVVYNATLNEFLVVFIGDDKPEMPNPNPPPPFLVLDTNEVYAQRVAANGTLSGGQLRVSNMGVDDNNGSYDALNPDVVWNSTDNQYLVVWGGEDNSNGLVNGEQEIFGQRLGYSSGNLVEIGTNDFQISMMGGANGAGAFDAREPAVTWNSTNNDYLVVWQADDNTGGRVDNRFIIFGRRYDGNGTALDASFFQISTIGAVSDTSVETFSPDAAYNSTSNEYLVVWEGDGANSTVGSANDFEIWGQRLNGASGAAVGANTQLSNMGSAGNANFTAQTAAVTYNPNNQEYLLVWRGDTNTDGLVDGEFEIFGLRLSQTLTTIEGMLRLSDMGTNGVPNPGLQPPAVAYSNSSVGNYLVVWAGENPGVTVAGEGEVWGQLVASIVADLQVTKTRNTPSNPAPGEAVQYTITYSNLGPDTVSNIVLTDLIPAEVTGISFTTSGITGSAPVLRAGTTYIWDIAQLASGQGGTITINGTVGAGVGDGTTVGNTASIATTTGISDANSANNSQTASFTVDVGPAVTINQAAGQADPTASSPINFTVVFSESVSNFVTGDVMLSGTAGATTAVVSGSGTTYNVAVSGMTTNGTVIASIAAGVATNAGGKANTASTSMDNAVTFITDTTPPNVAFSSAAPNPTNVSPIPVTVTFSENVTGFTAADIMTSNGTVNNFAGSGAMYTFDLVPAGQGLVTADISAGVAQDLGGNPNTAATQFSRTYDSVAPTVTVNRAAGQADPTSASPINFTVVFNEAVTGFGNSAADVTLSGTAGATTAMVTGSGITYNVAVSGMSAVGTVIVTIPAGAAQDLATNPSAASTSTDNSVDYDPRPDLTLSKSDGGATAMPGTAVSYTLSYANVSNQTATNVVLTETVPDNTTFTGSGWTCVPNNNPGSTCTRSVGTLIPSASGLATFTVTVSNPVPAGLTQISNMASIADDGTNGSDANPANNSASDTTPVTAQPDLVLTKSDGGATATPGGVISYTLTYFNNGNQGATGVVLTETVPANTTFTGSGWTCAPNNNAGSTCTRAVGALAGGGANGSATFAVTVTNPLPLGVTQISNSASITDDGANGTDPTPANNNSSDTTPLVLPPTITPTNFSRAAGSTTANLTIATVNDVETPKDQLRVQLSTDGVNFFDSITAGNVTVALADQNANAPNVNPTAAGDVSATITTPCNATVGPLNLFLRVTDSSGQSDTKSWALTITSNPPPVLTFNPQTVVAGTTSTITPATGPSDNGTFTLGGSGISPNNGGLVVQLNQSNGVVTVLNALLIGSYIVTIPVTDDCGATHNAQLTVNIVCPPISLSPVTLANGIVGTSYNQTLSAAPGGTSYSYAVTSGSLPPGLSLNPTTGALTGTPSAAGNYTFGITATGWGGCTKTQSYSLLITGTCATVTVNPSSLPVATIGTAYNQTVTATGGTAPYTFAVTQGVLPAGLTLNTGTGEITGTPTFGGSFSFRITATGQGGCAGSRTYVITVSCGTLTFAPATLPNGTRGAAYSQQLSVSPGNSATFSLLIGSLPPGFTLNSAGLLSGTTSQAGTYNFTVKALAGSCQGTKAYSLMISSSLAALALRGDYDGDGKSDPTLWSAQTGIWHISKSSTLEASNQAWGTAGDVTLLGDYDGDGLSDLAVFRPREGTFYVKRSSDGSFLVKQWGLSSDMPVPGDYDGDGKTDIAVWRGSTGTWYILYTGRSSDGQYEVRAWGSAAAPYNDVPVAGDYDGDGKTDLAVFRRTTGTWLVKRSSDGQYLVKQWGLGTDVPVAQDYDGDGQTDLAVWRGATGTWYIWQSTTDDARVTPWGTTGDQALASDYDGDGQADVAVWRTAEQTWYIHESGTQRTQMRVQGKTEDVPVGVNVR